MKSDVIRTLKKNSGRILLAAFSLTLLMLMGCGGSGGGSAMLPMSKKVKTPVFTPTGGTYSSDMGVTITCATDGATIYYTDDGNDPDSSSSEYFAPVPVAGNGTVKTIKAIAVLVDMDNSDIATATYTIDYAKVSSPQFGLAAQKYDHDISVSITSATAGATIYYTTNGDDPSAASAEYTDAIPVTGDGADVTIKAIAIKTGMEDSTTESAHYQIEYVHVAVPTFNISTGTYNHDLSIELSCTEAGAVIYYTTNGDTPSSATSPQYTTGIPVTGHGTVKTINAIAVKAGMANSSMASATYTISYDKVSTPQFNPVAGPYNHDINVAITCSTGGVTIYYTTNGDEPTTASSQYTAAIPVAGNNTTMTIKAIAVKTGMLDSTTASGDYVIQWPTVATPVVNCTTGSEYTYIFKSETVTITSGTSGATIYYTTNGDDPTTGSTQYTAPFTISGLGASVTVKAIAVKSAMVNSAVGQKTFTVDARDVYIAGYYGYTVGGFIYQYAAYWKNGGSYIQVRDDSNYPAGDPTRIFVSGNITYISGSGSGTAWVWVTNSPAGTYLFYLPGSGGHANGLYVDGTTVYTTGYYMVSGNYNACYWTGQTRTAITTAYRSQGEAIVLSGTDVYVAGWNQASSTDPMRACVWVNGTKTDLSVPAGTTSSYATDIILSGGDVYIAGLYVNAGVSCSCYWKNGARTDLETSVNTTVTGLAVSGTDAYVAGSKSVAGYWLNTSWIPLNYDRAVGISVFGSDVYVLESHYTGALKGIHITKNGTVVREITGDYHYPVSLFVK